MEAPDRMFGRGGASSSSIPGSLGLIQPGPPSPAELHRRHPTVPLRGNRGESGGTARGWSEQHIRSGLSTRPSGATVVVGEANVYDMPPTPKGSSGEAAAGVAGSSDDHALSGRTSMRGASLGPSSQEDAVFADILVGLARAAKRNPPSRPSLPANPSANPSPSASPIANSGTSL